MKAVCHGDVMVKTLACDSIGREFDSQSIDCKVATLGKLFTPMCHCHQWYQSQGSDVVLVGRY